MQPKGKTKQLIDAMQAQPDKVLWTVPECAEVMGLQAGVSSHLSGAVRREWLFKHDLGGRRVAFSLQPPEAEEAEAEDFPAFNAGLWADGDLVLVGVQLNEDGHSITLGPDKVRLLCRLLHGQGPET